MLPQCRVARQGRSKPGAALEIKAVLPVSPFDLVGQER
jgi:hypothetical protein